MLRSWTDALLAELDLAGTEVDIDAVLGLAGVVARGVVRPAAPLTAFLVGLAVGRAGADAPEAFERAAHRARALAATGDFAA
ncbi:hypothetical protein G3T37_13105 [Galbitalea soli]|uniref:DUF6457 domain-containing protein n=1 Tax=Galbitalea soli TaxID=1268042 RepID=A0A7C9PPP4_9MICO|nr:hypothetical protein [Galbitalea soli]